jgi:Domain of unknown function (DUF4286)
MIIYNVTIKIQSAILQQWLIWLKEEHIPEILNTGCFTQSNILQLLETDDSEGPTYALQFHAESKAQYNRYIELFSAGLRKKSYEKWGDQFIAFRSVMQVVN